MHSKVKSWVKALSLLNGSSDIFRTPLRLHKKYPHDFRVPKSKGIV